MGSIRRKWSLRRQLSILLTLGDGLFCWDAMYALYISKSVQACSCTFTARLFISAAVSSALVQAVVQVEMNLLFPPLLLFATARVTSINYGYGRQPRAQRAASPPPERFQQWERVRDVVPNAPPQKLFVEWPNNVRVQPNDTIST